LASNALLESIVYAHRAATKSILLLKTTSEQVPQLPEWDGGKYYTQKTTNETEQLRAQLQNTMTKYMGLFKHTQGMIQAKKEVLQMYYDVQKIYNKAQLTSAFCELRNMIGVAYLMVEQALQIKQNNGTFYNQDYAE
jgi:L-aspartate oxidase